MIEQVVSAYRLPSQRVRDFLSSIFGEQKIQIELKDDKCRMLIPRPLSEDELIDLDELWRERKIIDMQSDCDSDQSNEPRRRSRVPAPDDETVPLMEASAEESFTLPVESANADGTRLQYSLLDERLHVDYDRGALLSLYTIRVSSGLTCKVFEVNARWSWVSTGGSNSRNAKAFKVAVKRLEQETTPEEFAQEYQNLKAITKGDIEILLTFSMRSDMQREATYSHFPAQRWESQ